jgi:hypothetical protein
MGKLDSADPYLSGRDLYGRSHVFERRRENGGQEARQIERERPHFPSSKFEKL